MIRIWFKDKSFLFHTSAANSLDVQSIKKCFPSAKFLKLNGADGDDYINLCSIDHIIFDENIEKYEVLTEDPVSEKNDKLEKLISHYFNAKYTYVDICKVLCKKHNYKMSLKALERFLKVRNMRRKNIVESPTPEIVAAVVIELENSGFNLGYRSLWQRLQREYNLTVKQETVLSILQVCDPIGIEERKRTRLKRRAYITPGPNHLWHADGYDKIKRFGFPIHGCVDGFSRKIIWMEVCHTNNKPEVVATFFAQAVKRLKCLPTILRTDKGTENGTMASMQQCLRSSHHDMFSGESSHVYGKSTHNQRVEAMWGQLRQRVTGYYINLFQSLQDQGIINIHYKEHVECLRFCFGNMIAEDLLRFIAEWNSHHVRKQRARNILGGKPNVMYDVPEKYGGVECKKPVSLQHLEILRETYCDEPIWCSKESEDKFKQFVPDAVTPVTARDALLLLKQILNQIQLLSNDENTNSSNS